MKNVFLLLIITVCFLGLTGCGDNPAAADKGAATNAGAGGQLLINGAGATFPTPMYSKWFDAYNKMFPQIKINYQSIGSGGGIRQVTEGTVDFGASDMVRCSSIFETTNSMRATSSIRSGPTAMPSFRYE